MRRRAARWARPVPFAAPGEVIAELLDYIEAVDRWEDDRRRHLNAIRESLAFQVSAHVKALGDV